MPTHRRTSPVPSFITLQKIYTTDLLSCSSLHLLKFYPTWLWFGWLFSLLVHFNSSTGLQVDLRPVVFCLFRSGRFLLAEIIMYNALSNHVLMTPGTASSQVQNSTPILKVRSDLPGLGRRGCPIYPYVSFFQWSRTQG